MKPLTFTEHVEKLENLQIHAFGYELLREVLLPNLLGKEHSAILYWAGKRLARNYPLSSLDELASFFQTANWGMLTKVQEKKNELIFELQSDLISKRLDLNKDVSFQLEAGFIAEQIEQMNNYVTETYEEIKHRAKKVVFTVKWDAKDHKK
ncbi:YslB family protein [Bacillus sp. FJAT-47783]|uniref:YslB family protein n=1 Tax=Bacillus sp. FJAT-47783 TaxID=2922712 RepID=UPI001FAD4D1E